MFTLEGKRREIVLARRIQMGGSSAKGKRLRWLGAYS